MIETRLQTDPIPQVGRVINWREGKVDQAKKHQISESHVKKDRYSLILLAPNTYTQYKQDRFVNKLAPNTFILIWGKTLK